MQQIQTPKQKNKKNKTLREKPVKKSLNNYTKSLSCSCGGGCPRCKKPIQAKLKVNQPNDPYEQEADRIANQIMQMPVNVNSKIKSNVQRKSSFSGGMDVSSDFTNQMNNSSGKPLDNSTKSFMESRLNHDFSNVRVHNNSKAHELTSSVNARAFTKGNDIFLGKNELTSDTKLMAHELVHTLQQEQGNNFEIQRFEAIEHRDAGNDAQIEFPYNAKINTNMTALRSDPSKDQKNTAINTIVDLLDDVQVVALAKKGGWVKVLVKSGTAINKKREKIQAVGLIGYVSQELLTKENQDFDQELEIAPGVVLSYGHFVAMGGDLFRNFEQITKETQTKTGRNNLNKLSNVIDSESSGKVVNYEDPNVINKEYAVRYKVLALENISHFVHGGESVKTWTEIHSEAILDAFNAGTSKSIESLQIAMAKNGFADHFLTDSFAAGHIRVPRKDTIKFYQQFASDVFDNLITFFATRIGTRIFELLQRDFWRARNFAGDDERQEAIQNVQTNLNNTIFEAGGKNHVQQQMGLYLAGLSKLQHDRENKSGLFVISKAHPEGWTAFGDGKIHGKSNKKNYEFMLEAVKSSKQDIVDAFNVGSDKDSKHKQVNQKTIDIKFEILQKSIKPYKSLNYIPELASNTPKLPSVEWGKLEPMMQKEIVDLVSTYLTDELVNEFLKTIDETENVEIDWQPDMTARPREAMRDVLNEFRQKSNMIHFLEQAFNRSALDKK